MSDYEYKKGKERIDAILANRLEIIEQDKLPSDNAFTYTNSYKSWVTGVFVDIRKSTELFANEDKIKVSKVIRSFTSEVIEILRTDDNLRDIGIRGDCVFAIYTTPTKDDVSTIAGYTYYINTFMKMLNVLLANKSLPRIDVGIGISTAKDLVIKAGRKDTGINDMVWIGEAVTRASNLSSIANKDGYGPIVFSTITYDNIIEKQVKLNGEAAKNWFTKRQTYDMGSFYDANIIKMEFNNWIDQGMKG